MYFRSSSTVGDADHCVLRADVVIGPYKGNYKY